MLRLVLLFSKLRMADRYRSMLDASVVWTVDRKHRIVMASHWLAITLILRSLLSVLLHWQELYSPFTCEFFNWQACLTMRLYLSVSVLSARTVVLGISQEIGCHVINKENMHHFQSSWHLCPRYSRLRLCCRFSQVLGMMHDMHDGSLMSTLTAAHLYGHRRL